MISTKAARADLAVAHEILSAVDATPSLSVATRVHDLASQLLEARERIDEQADEIAWLRRALEEERAHRRERDVRLLVDLEREARA